MRARCNARWHQINSVRLSGMGATTLAQHRRSTRVASRHVTAAHAMPALPRCVRCESWSRQSGASSRQTTPPKSRVMPSSAQVMRPRHRPFAAPSPRPRRALATPIPRAHLALTSPSPRPHHALTAPSPHPCREGPTTTLVIAEFGPFNLVLSTAFTACRAAPLPSANRPLPSLPR